MDSLRNLYTLIKVATLQCFRCVMPVYCLFWATINIPLYISSKCLWLFAARNVLHILLCIAVHYCSRRFKLADRLLDEVDSRGNIDDDENRASFAFLLFVLSPICGIILHWCFGLMGIVSIASSMPVLILPYGGCLERLVDGSYYLYTSPLLLFWLFIFGIGVFLLCNFVEPSLRMASRLFLGVTGDRVNRIMKNIILIQIVTCLLSNSICYVSSYLEERYPITNSWFLKTQLLRRYGLISRNLYNVRVFAQNELVFNNSLDENTKAILISLVESV